MKARHSSFTPIWIGCLASIVVVGYVAVDPVIAAACSLGKLPKWSLKLTKPAHAVWFNKSYPVLPMRWYCHIYGVARRTLKGEPPALATPGFKP
jgi:hypothetical protein